MSGVITCLLENEMGLIPFLDGKSLMIAFIGALGVETASNNAPPLEPEPSHPNVIRLDFGAAPKTATSLANILDFREFLSPAVQPRWIDATPALQVVQNILSNLREGATHVVVPPSYETAIAEPDLKHGVIRDLEELRKILQSAARASTRVALLLDY
ncbi:MAG: hypothetical protein JWN25_460 [Verrucomicrobiales bacterium]|nr:hypothetical protein [Verrucomicrobiales bacterium]MDB6129254.1 hypothetical protein [Verrucomicrobiales bacterium]